MLLCSIELDKYCELIYLFCKAPEYDPSPPPASPKYFSRYSFFDLFRKFSFSSSVRIYPTKKFQGQYFRSCSSKQVFLKIQQVSQENTILETFNRTPVAVSEIFHLNFRLSKLLNKLQILCYSLKVNSISKCK